MDFSMLRTVESRRNYFPRGLSQPEGAFRFSEDALLLASFANKVAPRAGLAIDLGSGCAVIGLALLLLGASAQIVGFEKQKELIESARINANNLELTDKISSIELDLQFARGSFSTILKDAIEKNNLSTRDHQVACSFYNGYLEAGGADLIVCNPPYRLIENGRVPKSELRRVALFARKDELAIFTDAASKMVQSCGAVCFAFIFERLLELTAELARANFKILEIMQIKGSAEQPVKMVLVYAVRKTAETSEVKLESMDAVSKEAGPIYSELILRESSSNGKGMLTNEARLFCKYLI